MTNADKTPAAVFGAYAFGWAYWQREAQDRRRTAVRRAAVEAVLTAVGGFAFAALVYAWTVLLFALEVP